MAKRKAGEATLDVVVDGQLVEIMPLGAGQEVGRSCILVKYMCAAAPPRIVPFVGFVYACICFSKWTWAASLLLLAQQVHPPMCKLRS